jgi:nucleoside-diphosphate-sugar epimerase
MKVLLIGATGNLGSRLVAALLSHNHRVVAFVRSPKKLESLIPSSVYCQLDVIQGSVNTPAIKSAILDSRCDAVVNVAGLASLAPWAHSDLPEIFRAVLTAVHEAGAERGQPLRAWFVAGTGVLNYPGTETMLSSL